MARSVDSLDELFSAAEALCERQTPTLLAMDDVGLLDARDRAEAGRARPHAARQRDAVGWRRRARGCAVRDAGGRSVCTMSKRGSTRAASKWASTKRWPRPAVCLRRSPICVARWHRARRKRVATTARMMPNGCGVASASSIRVRAMRWRDCRCSTPAPPAEVVALAADDIAALEVAALGTGRKGAHSAGGGVTCARARCPCARRTSCSSRHAYG